MNMKKSAKLMGLTLLILTVVLAPTSFAGPPISPSHPTAPFVKGELLLRVTPGASSSEIAGKVGATVLHSIGDGSIQLLKVEGRSASAAAQVLDKRRDVVFAEPNWLRELDAAPNDSGYYLKWDLNNNGSLCDSGGCATAGADMSWQEAYTLLGSSFSGSAVVAVVDTGIDPNHPDLSAKIIPGYDFLDNDTDPSDTYGHGTHVSGIALGETNNSIGTAGVGYSPNIKVMPLRVCDQNGCPTSAIVNAIYYAADNGANVINMSLGGRVGSSAEQQAIDYAWGKGLVITASSGNDGSGKVSYPAAYPNCIAVGSTNWYGQLARYSNRGSDLDVVAPGGDMSYYHDPAGIYSTMPTYPVYLTTSYSYSENYDQLQGTSMSAPQVSGLAGLLFAVGVADTNGDGMVNDEVRQIIQDTADDLGAAGWDSSFGWGRINVYDAVLAAQGTPPPSSQPSASFTYAASGLTVNFTDTSTDSGGTITGWSWDFGDGSPLSIEQNPSHTYAAGGTYTVDLTVTDNNSATSSTSQNVTVSSGGTGGTLHVSSIAMSSKIAGPNRSAIAVVTVEDSNGSPVSGATVYGTWSGDYSGSVNGTTANDGTVKFQSGKVRQSATFVFTIDNVGLSGYTYDASSSVTSASITVP